MATVTVLWAVVAAVGLVAVVGIGWWLWRLFAPWFNGDRPLG